MQMVSHKRRLLLVAAAATGLASVPSVASAQAVPAYAATLAPAALAPALKAACTFDPQASAQLAAPQAALPKVDKASAILGGAPSALERLKMQQAGVAVAQIEPAAGMAETSPAVSGVFKIPGLDCGLASEIAAPTTQVIDIAKPSLGSNVTYSGRTLGADDFLASKRLGIRKTTFDSDWKRVGHKGVSRAKLHRTVGKAQSGMALLDQVNRWVNRNVRHVEDRDNWGQRDYWAPASVTLATRRGDCEDFAIAKMQLLAAAGIKREDMFLTIARDLVRNADHAVLVVKHDGGWAMLDNNTDQVLDARQSHDYRPILSYSANKSWLHGY